MLLAEIAATWRAVGGTAARKEKTALIARCLRDAGADHVETTVSYLSGELPQRQIGVGYASLRELPAPAAEASLTVPEVDAAFSAIKAVGGAGSVAARKELLHGLLSRATQEEQDFLIRLLGGELRQGALDGVMTDAIAKAAEVPLAVVRRAMMLRGALGPVARAALEGGAERLGEFTLQIGRPLKPMLAASAPSVAEALIEEMAVEWKMDGVRAQIHVAGDEVHVFTRTLDEITERLPGVVETMRDLKLADAVFDGELIVLKPDGSPEPFQVTASRTSTHGNSGGISTFLFDVLHLNGEDLLDEPGSVRNEALVNAVPERLRMPRIVTADVDEAQRFFTEAVRMGHEGVVVKSLETPYTAGRRGAGWIKVKPRHTLDLVVLAVEWGSGRRTGKLSNIHLGARDPETGGFVMLGKTFKGMTDKILDWQTERFQEIKTGDDGWVVKVQPVEVVEIAFDGLQNSSRYPGGLALRFARVLRYRPDKTPEEADTIDTVRSLAGLSPDSAQG